MRNKTELGFGIMRLPLKDNDVDFEKADEIIEEYMKGDFCFFDFHPGYMKGKSQEIFKRSVSLKYERERYLVANKLPWYNYLKTYEDYQVMFESELEACDISYFDYYMLHAVTEDVYEKHIRVGGFKLLEEEKKNGRIKKAGISFHDKPELLEKILKNHPVIDFVVLQINFVDWESNVICSKECYEIARKYNKEIIVMEPVKGGSLSKEIEIDGKKLTLSEMAEIALSFVKNLDGISVVLSGMSDKKQVIENRRTIASDKIYPDELYDTIRRKLSENSYIPCTKCNYCMVECPKGIKVPDIFSLVNGYYNKGKYDRTAQGRYRIYYNGYIGKGRASECIKCGKCEKRCPQKIEIRKKLKEAETMFENNTGNGYTSEKNIQIIISLLKQHGIKKIIASPGTTNSSFIFSIQNDGWFEVYSSADERSAAYIACGLAAESGEPVVLSCTGATASRNYIPALTEAYYRKLPVLAITSTQNSARIGHNIPQVIDRTSIQNDIARFSGIMPSVNSKEDEWKCIINANKAILALKHNGGGPAHINLETTYSKDFSVKNLPIARKIERVSDISDYPDIPEGRIAVFCGSHKKWDVALTDAVDKFCEKYGAFVIADHTSNYKGKYGLSTSVLFSQDNPVGVNVDLLIHIGDVSGGYYNFSANNVFRVNPDGEIVDTFKKLTVVFEEDEQKFFENYISLSDKNKNNHDYFNSLKEAEENLRKNIPELPFSNVWIAKNTLSEIPEGSVVHLGILNTLRSFSFFPCPTSVDVYSNTGGFGIDGCVSSLIGASLCNSNRLYFGFVGDLAFFYDMNSMGNRHIGNNLRLIVINNGKGTEFKNYNHIAASHGDETDEFVAAAGHYGNKSENLLKGYAEALGFEYFSADTKEKYLSLLPSMLSTDSEKSIVVEVFTNDTEESLAIKTMRTLNGEKKDVNFAIKKPSRLKEEKKEIVIFGAGLCLNDNLDRIRNFATVRYVADNNSSKWGKKIIGGLTCISPDEILKIDNAYVLIAIENPKIAFTVASQLLDMKITDFDYIHNWFDYAEREDYI